jgi:nucleoside-diphosphate-sugar epimerase
MRVFVTGATGFVGAAVVNELLSAGHTVLGLSRSNEGAEKLNALGADASIGNVNDPEVLAKCIAECDAVIHTAFNHDDFTKYKQNCEDDRRVIEALADSLAGTYKPLVVTSGIGVLHYDRIITENDAAPSSDVMPRAATEEAAIAAAAKGINAYIVRLPPTVHGKCDRGFIPMLTAMAKQKGKSAYIGSGDNLWPAVHRLDAAKVYRLIIEKQPEQGVYHAVAEQGIAFKEIATEIGKGLNLPVEGLSHADAEKHFTWFLHFAGMSCAATSSKTQATLNWKPSQTELLDDLEWNYF